uniref:Putative salivary kunitz domain protein n=1 Tax=Ixodes ricinus TaxID=34613 RepID=A0A0K8R687_IXORI
MKATLVAICFFAALAYSTARLSEQQCRMPVPSTSCASGDVVRTIYYFDSNTNKCESKQSCGVGINHFEKLECCKSECPYGGSF